MPTTLTDVITLVALLLGSITAGLMFVRPLQRRPPGRRSRARRPSPRSAPTMLGAGVSNAAESAPPVDPRPRRWPSTSRTGMWSTSSVRRLW